MKKFLIIAFASLVLAGCGKNCKCDIPPPNEFVVVDPDPVPPLDLKEVEWQVWNQGRLAQEGANAENKDKVFFVLTQEQANAFFDNLNKISDTFSKSVTVNKYWQDSVNAYRKKTAEAKEKNTKDSTK